MCMHQNMRRLFACTGEVCISVHLKCKRQTMAKGREAPTASFGEFQGLRCNKMQLQVEVFESIQCHVLTTNCFGEAWQCAYLKPATDGWLLTIPASKEYTSLAQHALGPYCF